MSRYDELIASLKNECRKKRVSYRDIIKKLNRFEYDEIINDERIGDIIQDIIAEREDIARIARDIYNKLTFLNELLEIFGEEPQTSLTKARKLFKTKIFINIYDLCDGRYNKRTTKELLRKDLRQNPERRFPLKLAKGTRFKCFLIGI
jgi:type I site-specific restriction-modification system R (restriction) subunit